MMFIKTPSLPVNADDDYDEDIVKLVASGSS